MKTQEWLVCTSFTEKNSVLSFMFSQTQIIIGEKAERRSRNFILSQNEFYFCQEIHKKHPEKTRANGLCIQVFQNIFIIPLSGFERIILNGYYINFFEGFCNARFIQYKKSYTMNMFFDTMGYKMEEKSVQKFQNWFKKTQWELIDKRIFLYLFIL